MLFFFRKIKTTLKTCERKLVAGIVFKQAVSDAVVVAIKAGNAKRRSDQLFSPVHGGYTDQLIRVNIKYYDLPEIADVEIDIRLPSATGDGNEWVQVLQSITGSAAVFRQGKWCAYLRQLAAKSGSPKYPVADECYVEIDDESVFGKVCGRAATVGV